MAELFDKYDASYGAAVQSSIEFSGLPHSFFLQAKADLLRGLVDEHVGGPQRPQMLDVGCGVGSLHPYLRGLADGLCGIDVSAASIAQAQRANPAAEYRVFDGRSIPYDTGRFDLVTAVCVLHHVPPAQWRDFVSEMRRVVRPGGLVCIIEHNPFNPLTRLAVSRCEFDRDAVLLGLGKARQLMTGVGLHAVDARYFLLLPTAAKLARRVEIGLRRLPLGAQYAVWGTC
jgi:SAM-dependent methyltransferase